MILTHLTQIPHSHTLACKPSSDPPRTTCTKCAIVTTARSEHAKRRYMMPIDCPARGNSIEQRTVEQELDLWCSSVHSPRGAEDIGITWPDELLMRLGRAMCKCMTSHRPRQVDRIHGASVRCDRDVGRRRWRPRERSDRPTSRPLGPTAGILRTTPPGLRGRSTLETVCLKDPSAEARGAQGQRWSNGGSTIRDTSCR
jgi:hypothetical protein